MRVRLRITVEGIVQGVGFRPFVHALASSLHLAGMVGNDTAGVFVEVEGSEAAVDSFVARLESEAPPLAVIERVETARVASTGDTEFAIVESERAGERQTLVSPDIATCDDCLRELFDPSDRRFRYPFINCTNCGPRFTIVRDVPYDRAFTTMADFVMCAECEREYHDPGDRRFHAQPVCCPACGPSLQLIANDGTPLPGDPLMGAVALLRDGGVVAIKGLGGYHLAVLATSEAAAAALRARKHREDKPFAVMVRDIETARWLCEIDGTEEQLLSGIRRPIVLLERRPDGGSLRPVAPSVAPGNRLLGLMLPYTPVHHLIARELDAPFVLTSGNVSDEPIVYRDEVALERLSGIADAFLTHDRPIHVRTDDAVVLSRRGRQAVLRRSRGFVPQPIAVRDAFRRQVLACGAELKNTFCLGKGRRVFLSHHMGDLENYETLCSFAEGIEHFERFFDIRPEVVAHDLHPGYLSTKYAMELTGIELVGVQHHHAHVASCLADNGEAGPVIGIACDGLGYGVDGSLWGGEFLVADLVSFARAGHLQPVPMPGGVAAIKEPWRMAAVYLDAAFGRDLPRGLGVADRNGHLWEKILAVSRSSRFSPTTSSAGRLFDAVASIMGLRDRINYEGQAAVELEQIADPAERSTYRIEIEGTEPFLVPGTEIVRRVALDLLAGIAEPVVAARFHNAVADALVDGCERIRESTGIDRVALSGGVFQNRLLAGRTADGLQERGFGVLEHARVPTNDGGISLGQAVVAAARDAAGLL